MNECDFLRGGQVLGSGLSIITIGTTSCVTILSRDAYSNLRDATWMINITSLTKTTPLIRNTIRSSFASLVMCYPPAFSAAQVGFVSVFVLTSDQEAPRLIDTPKPLYYVSNVVCAAKCVITGSGLSLGA